MSRDHKEPEADWREIAASIIDEPDPDKVIELAKELLTALDAQAKTKGRGTA